MSQNSFSESGNSPPSTDPSSSTDTRTSDKGVAGIRVWCKAPGSRHYVCMETGERWRTETVLSSIRRAVAKQLGTGGIKPSPENKD